MRILLLAGGSGGHISPALAVAAKLREKNPSADIYFFTSRTDLDKNIFEKSEEKYTRIFSGKWRRYFSWQNFVDPLFIVIGFFQSLFLMITKRPDVIFSKGGFSALPPVFAATVLRIPIIVHESDATAGIANRITKRFARMLLTSFPTNDGLHVGTPLRTGIESANGNNGKKFLDFKDEKKPILFGFGGSQGGKNMNQICAKALPKILEKANVVWISGPKNLRDFDNIKDDGLRVYPYIYAEFFDVLAAADVVICRSGSSSIFESAAMEKPMLMIPLSTAAGNHQEKNAKLFAEKNAAKVILEKDLDEDIFLDAVEKMIKNKDLQKIYTENAAKMGKTNAAEKIAEIILEEGRN